MMRSVVESFLDIVFPRNDEVQSIEQLTSKELLETCATSKVCIDNFIPIFRYKDTTVRKIIWEIKYNKNKRLAFSCAEILAGKIDALLSKHRIPPSSVSLITIPISSKRLKKRGYNQTELIAERIQKFLPYTIMYAPHTLRKTKDVPTQTKKTASERRKNIAKCFSVIDGGKIRNKTVILFDDVVTTGATIEEAYKEIQKHKPKDVFFITLAH